jgi:hypothetical protein
VHAPSGVFLLHQADERASSGRHRGPKRKEDHQQSKKIFEGGYQETHLVLFETRKVFEMEILSQNSSDNFETDQAPRLPAEGLLFCSAVVDIVSKIPGNGDSRGYLQKKMDE